MGACARVRASDGKVRKVLLLCFAYGRVEGMPTIEDIKLQPWKEARHGWRGELISADGASVEDFSESDVAEVLQYAETADAWDGETAGVIRLKDGRFVAWEADWGRRRASFWTQSLYKFSGQTQDAVLSRLTERARGLLRDYAVS